MASLKLVQTKNDNPLEEERMGRVLSKLHGALRKTAAGGSSAATGRMNPKGDISFGFDLASDEEARRVLEEELGPVRILSEEAGELDVGEGDPLWRVVLDPVDGSDNHARGLPLSAISAAVLPVDGPLHPSRVEWALVGVIKEDVLHLAARGRGAYRESRRLKVSRVSRLEDALLSFELNHIAPPRAMGNLLARARGVRAYGCASRAICLVAQGALDAHVDVRNRLTPESFFAAALILEEAGGCLIGPEGKEIEAAEGLTHRTSLIAAANRKLAGEIVEALSQ